MAQACVIWLHGLGADGHDFVPMVEALDTPNLAVRYLLPHAPQQAITINGGYVMRAWYDIRLPDLRRDADEEGILRSVVAVQALVNEQVEAGIDSRRIVLGGFSQGGAIAVQAGLTLPSPLAGVVALSTYLALPERLAREHSDANRQTPLFVAHGTEDPIAPYALAEESNAWLQGQGYAVEFHSYPMPHSVCADEVADLNRFLLGCLPEV